MNRIATLVYGIICYVIFLITFIYAIGWVGNLYLPVTIDSAPLIPLGYALLIDIGLLTLFALQHSIMARPAFKRWWTQFIPVHIERSTYVLFSSLALIIMFVFWQPLGGVIWDVQNPLARMLLYCFFTIGWLIVLISTFLINHFDLFGLRQVWLYFRGQSYTKLKFMTPGLYKAIRHPLYAGFLIGFWFTPAMTAGHLFFAVITTAYILVAVRLEERDLITFLGEDYVNYRRKVPMLFPRLGKPK